jgi:hypothetical protein
MSTGTSKDQSVYKYAKKQTTRHHKITVLLASTSLKTPALIRRYIVWVNEKALLNKLQINK